MNEVERISISLPRSLVRFLEQYQTSHAVRSKSKVVERAVLMLREDELTEEYRQSALENDAAWDPTIGDGLHEPY
jgi:antitoxin ParD1/3/4